MNDYPPMDRLAELQQMIADFAKVKRVPYLADNGQPENDVEHSFGLAMTCWYLQPKVAPELDVSKVLRYALAHDIVELHAGDTYVFDVEHSATKDAREREALSLLTKEWQDFPELTRFADGYLNKSDEEAKFVKAVDKILPVVMIDIGRGGSHWEELGVNLQMEIYHKKSILVSDYVAPYYKMLIDWLDERDNIPKN